MAFKIKICNNGLVDLDFKESLKTDILIANDNLFALRGIKQIKLSQSEIEYNFKQKSLLISFISNKENYYIFIGYSLIHNVINKRVNKLKLDDLIGQNIINSSAFLKLLEIEYNFYSNLNDSINVDNATSLAFIYQCILVVLRKIHSITSDINYSLNQNTINQLLILEDWVLTNFHLPTPSIEEMANRLNMSTSKFKSIFNKVYSTSPHQYFLNLKLKKACNTLHFTDLSVSEVSFKYGFNHPSGFSRFIKSKLGISPIEFNEKIKF